jgi:hypothetical protein
MPSQEVISQLARDLHEAGLVDLDKPLRALVDAPGLKDDAGTVVPAWNAAFGSGYVLVYRN